MSNCPYCNTGLAETEKYCGQCGAPNRPEPVAWYKSAGVTITDRVRAAFSATKPESVWADRLASLMPVQFVVSAIVLWLSLKPLAIVAAIISIVALLSILAYYPGWYKVAPEKRKEYGWNHFVITLIQIIIYTLW